MSGRGAPKQQSGGRGGGGRGGSSGKRESILELAKVRLLTFYGASWCPHFFCCWICGDVCED